MVERNVIAGDCRVCHFLDRVQRHDNTIALHMPTSLNSHKNTSAIEIKWAMYWMVMLMAQPTFLLTETGHTRPNNDNQRWKE